MLDQRNRLSDKVVIGTGAGATASGDFVAIGQAIRFCSPVPGPRFCWWTGTNPMQKLLWRLFEEKGQRLR